MKTFSPLMTIVTKKILEKAKIFLAIACLFSITLGLAKLIILVKTDLTNIPITIGIGIALGIFAEVSFDLETLFVGGLIVLMLISFALMVLLTFLPASWFKLIFILVAMAFLSSTSAIVMQWLIKNWICKSFGKLYGLLIAVIAISLGMMFSTWR